MSRGARSTCIQLPRNISGFWTAPRDSNVIPTGLGSYTRRSFPIKLQLVYALPYMTASLSFMGTIIRILNDFVRSPRHVALCVLWTLLQGTYSASTQVGNS